MSRALLSIAEVIEQPEFPAVDVALRKGCHIDREDGDWFALLHDGQEHVEAWYRRYGCELIYKTDGYFYLLPTSDKFPKRQLGASEMLVGQTLALLYLDPRTVERGGVITREAIVEQLVTVLGADTLISAFLPNRKRLDERVAQKEVRSKIADATRKLSTLGFATQLPDDKWQLRASVMRFAEPVRGVEDPMEALSRLVAEGDVSLEDLGEQEAHIEHAEERVVAHEQHRPLGRELVDASEIGPHRATERRERQQERRCLAVADPLGNVRPRARVPHYAVIRHAHPPHHAPRRRSRSLAPLLHRSPRDAPALAQGLPWR